MWLKHNRTFQKSELHQLMPNVSQRTAVKYIQIAIDHGLLIEQADPEDLRSKRITMSAGLKRKIELFLDYSISVFEGRPESVEGEGSRTAGSPRVGDATTMFAELNYFKTAYSRSRPGAPLEGPG